MNPPIWTGEARRLLYQQLTRQFGPYSTWAKVCSPGNGNDQAFGEFIEAFAKLIGAQSGRAVNHQIRFALPHNGQSTWINGGQVQTAILNKAAALEAGFIENKHLPTLVARGARGHRDEFNPLDDIRKSVAVGFEAIRDRKASGGPGWKGHET